MPHLPLGRLRPVFDFGGRRRDWRICWAIKR